VLRTPFWLRAPGRAGKVDNAPLDCIGLLAVLHAALSDRPLEPPAAGGFAVLSSPRGIHGGLSGTLMFSTVRPDGWKLIFEPRLGLLELYALPADPAELQNRADTEPRLLEAMLSRLLGQAEQCAQHWLPTSPASNY
jgi:hypothetical protein